MSEVSRIEVPFQLRHEKWFLCWRYGPPNAQGKRPKVPYYASGIRRSGDNGGDEDRARLVTFPVAKAAAVKLGMDGIGMALLPDSGITVADFDKCIGPDGEIPEDVARIVFRAHAEFSPSGTGIHAILEGNLGDIRHHPEDGLEIDTFTNVGFVTMTGKRLEGTLEFDQPLAGVDTYTREFCEALGARAGRTFDPDNFMAGLQPGIEISYPEIVDVLCKLDPSLRYPAWRDVGMGMHHQFHKRPPEGMLPMDGFELWHEWSTYGTGLYVDRDDCLKVWDSFKLETKNPIRFPTLIKMANTHPARPEVQVALRAALVPPAKAPTPEEVFSRPKPLLLMADPLGALQTPPSFSGRFVVGSLLDSINMPPMDWHIRPLVPAAELGMIYGPSGVGKSFVTLDMLCCIAMGMPWQGMPVRQGNVFYVCAEGHRAFGHRLRAWCEFHGVDPRELAKHFAVLNDAPNLCEADQAAAVISTVNAMGKIDIIACDTLARMTAGGDENSATDMGNAIGHAQDIHKATGATIMLIHHPGKDISLGARGSSAIKAALDFELLVTSNSEGLRQLKVTKMKDGEDGMRYGLMLDKVTLTPRDNDAFDPETGEVIPLTSRIVRMVEIPTDPMIADVGVLTENESFIIGVLDTLPPGKHMYSYGGLMNIIVAAAPPPLRDDNGVDLERDQRYFTYSNALDSLLKKKIRVRKQDGLIITS